MTVTSDVSGDVDVDPGTFKKVVEIVGEGELLCLFVFSNTKEMAWELRVDDVLLDLFDECGYSRFRYAADYRTTVEKSFLPFWTITKYDEALSVYAAVLTLPIPFHSSIKVRAYNGDTTTKLTKATLTVKKVA